MQWKDRQGNPVPGEDGQDKMLAFLYGTALGRGIVSLMIRPWVSALAGKLMDSRVSALAIRPFLAKNAIDLQDYEQRKWRSFNDFFTRRIREGMRPVDAQPGHLIAPCDSKLSVYSITGDARFLVKQTEYTLESLLRSRELAKRYEGGVLLLFRLTVGDYHRYSYPDGGVKGENVRLNGVFHTVNPVANDHYPIYKENTREYTILDSENFGPMLLMEVGATMVGRIVNYHGACSVQRGQEKGRFEFGGSTVIVCLEKDRVILDEDLVRNTREGIETVVKLGEKIGTLV
jgi:phosphatidylserine decarboxylase